MHHRSALFLFAVALPLVACSAGAGESDDTSAAELARGKHADCTKAECGPAPLVASQECKDGSTAGPSCGRNAKGSCGWTITSCASPANPPTCSPYACGPALGMLNKTCDDGSTAGPTCEPSANGACGWIITSCPAPRTCVDTDCVGPRPLSATRLCKDGSTAGPTCASMGSGSCGWTITSCP